MDEFVQFIADVWEAEEEYAGRMETWCFYCQEYQEPNEPESHKKDCLHLKALAIVNAAKLLGANGRPEKSDPGTQVPVEGQPPLDLPPCN